MLQGYLDNTRQGHLNVILNIKAGVHSTYIGYKMSSEYSPTQFGGSSHTWPIQY